MKERIESRLIRLRIAELLPSRLTFSERRGETHRGIWQAWSKANSARRLTTLSLIALFLASCSGKPEPLPPAVTGELYCASAGLTRIQLPSGEQSEVPIREDSVAVDGQVGRASWCAARDTIIIEHRESRLPVEGMGELLELDPSGNVVERYSHRPHPAFSPDCRSVAYSLRGRVAAESLGQGGKTRFFATRAYFGASISWLDNTRFVYRNEWGDLWVANADDGTQEGVFAGERWRLLAARGSEIVVADNDNRVLMADIDTEEVREIAGPSGRSRGGPAVWSPDGRWLVYSRGWRFWEGRSLVLLDLESGEEWAIDDAFRQWGICWRDRRE